MNTFHPNQYPLGPIRMAGGVLADSTSASVMHPILTRVVLVLVCQSKNILNGNVIVIKVIWSS